MIINETLATLSMALKTTRSKTVDLDKAGKALDEMKQMADEMDLDGVLEVLSRNPDLEILMQGSFNGGRRRMSNPKFGDARQEIGNFTERLGNASVDSDISPDR